MKSFWALPAVLRLVIASQQTFSVHNDLLAYPQYEIVYSESFIPAAEACERLVAQKARPRDPSEAKDTDLSTARDASSAGSPDSTDRDTYERLILNSKPYFCSIPYVAPALEGSSNNTASETQEEHQQELERASNHGWELLKGMRGSCIYYNAGWWVYSFCYDDGVKQFHRLPPGGGTPIYPPLPDPKVPPYVLGKFPAPITKSETKFVDGEEAQKPLNDGESTPADTRGGSAPVERRLGTELQTRGETNFLIQKLGHGDVCDLTGRERTVTIQFHCNPGEPDHIQMIKETASCVYLMVVHTPRLCNDVAFRPPQVDKPNIIACREIVEKNKEKAWRAIAAAKAAEVLSGNKKQKSDVLAAPVVIGGIELGGKKLVGETPERMIIPSNIVKPPKQQKDKAAKEKYVATLAKSDGTYTSVMSQREIKKAGVKASVEDINGLIDDVETWAGEGTPWRLELVEVNGGFEYRGIREDEDEELVGEAEMEQGSGSSDKKAGSKEEYKG
ncbi:hypothetical protein FH972_024204 [Carpinus fangiana]|uniref:MRH domain-containing protein n=1 Tax=Carpinus fangiana TaxID=176857 RepID=A0A5N6KXV7_9ROSI|nr:hypothetical protein FH972_024204 [Carpinus fangiana]